VTCEADSWSPTNTTSITDDADGLVYRLSRWLPRGLTSG